MDVAEVCELCRELNSEKTTERKRAVERLKRCLSRPSVKKALDRNFSEGRGSKKNFTWENVFRAVCVFVTMETADLKNASSSASKTTLTNRETRKQEASELMKFVIRLADKGGAKLKGSLLFEHIQETLKDDFMCEAFGQDYCSIMLKNGLPTRKYIVELNNGSWHELLSVFCKLFSNDHVRRVDKLVLARIIHAVLRGLTAQTDVRPKKILTFFTDFFSQEKARHHKSPSILEQMLKALLTLMHAIGPQSRVQLCKLGEDVTLTMLYLWKNVASQQLKDFLTEFLQIQMWAHHPGGVRQENPGAFALDWDKWMSCLRSVYELLYREILEGAGRTKQKDFLLKPAYIDLAVDVCNQLFTGSMQSIDVTQQSLLATNTQTEPCAKKRRLESNWESIRGLIVAAGSTAKLLPWVQLVTRLVEKYPESLPCDEVVPYLSCLSHALANCKRSDLIMHILRCLESFVSSWKKLVNQSSDRSDKLDQSEAVWAQVWSTTLRFVSLHHGEPGGYILLSRLLQAGLVQTGREIWSMFVPSVTLPHPHAATLLATCVQHCDLPENYIPKLVVTLQPIGEHPNFPLRRQLIDWLLPNKEEDSDWSQSQCGYKLAPYWIAHLLVVLTFRDPTALKMSYKNSAVGLSDLERTYLEISLQRSLLEGDSQTGGPSEATRPAVVHVADLLKLLEDKIRRDVLYYHCRTEIQVSELEEMLCYVEMMARVISLLTSHGIVTPEHVGSTQLSKQLKVLMKKITDTIVEMAKRDGHTKLMPAIQGLQRLYSLSSQLDNVMDNLAGNLSSFSVNRDSMSAISAGLSRRTTTSEGPGVAALRGWLRAITPARLVDVLWDILNEKHLNRAQSDSGAANQSRIGRSVSSGRRSRVLDDFDDEFETEVDDQSSHHGDVDDEDEMESQDTEETGAAEACSSLLSPRALPESQALRLETGRLLCLWCCHGNIAGHVRPEVDRAYTRSKVVALLKEKFDPIKPVDVQMLQVLVCELTRDGQTLDGAELTIVINAIRTAARHHRKDQELCCLCLDLLSLLVPSLAQTQASNMEESRESAVQLVRIFWTYQEKDGYSTPVRLSLLKILQKFITYDPAFQWCRSAATSLEEDSCETDGESTTTPATALVDYAADLSYNVRIHTAQAIKQLFAVSEDESGAQIAKATQTGCLTQLYDVMNECLDIQGKLSPERLADERQCRAASVLTTVAMVICVSQAGEKKAVLALLKMMRESDLNTEMTHTTVSQVAGALQYKSMEEYVESHLPYLLHHWLLLGYPISEWPYTLLACDTRKHFYRHYQAVIIPELVFGRHMDAVQAVATELGASPQDLLRDCVPRVVVHILPLFAASGLDELRESESVKKRTSRARKCYELLVTELTQDAVDRQIVDSLEAVVVNILMSLHDPDLDERNLVSCSPEPNPPSYNTYIITSTLDYLTKSFSGDGKTLVEILAKTPDSIERILLELATSLFTRHRLAEQLQVLQAYQLFVRLLLKQFSGQLGGSWAYVLREVIVRLVYLITDVTVNNSGCYIDKQYIEAIASMSLHLLRDVCTVAVELCPQELMKYLRLLVGHLVTTAQLHGNLAQQSIALLKYLILEKAKPLRAAIATLDNFPDNAMFKDCSEMHCKLKYSAGPFTLTQEIEHFLCCDGDQSLNQAPRLEGLKFLLQQLTDNQGQIATLSDAGLLCRLIRSLLQMAVGPSSQEVQLVACRCLGVIGPLNLNTACLPDTSTNPGLQAALDGFQEVKEAQMYCRIFHCLNEYLVDRSMGLVQCTSTVLKTLLSVKTGADFAAQYKTRLTDTEFLFHYLHPFRSGKKKAVKVETASRDWDNFLLTVDKESLWNPEHSSHGNWVVTLATMLISSGAVADEILKLLGPVCELKSDFSELILPYLIHDILRNGDDGHREVFSRQLNNFFSCHCNQAGQAGSHVSRGHSVASTDTDGEFICMNVKSVRTVLSVVQYLRQQARSPVGRVVMTPWDNNFWLELDYLQVAMAAQYCSAHFSTLLFAEIWCDVHRDRTSRSSGGSQSASQDPRIDTLSAASSSQHGVSVQDLLMAAHRWIGDPDAVYGCGAGRKADTQSRVCTYQLENQWDKAVIACDIQMERTHSASQYNVLHALQNFGAGHIFETYLQGAMDHADQPSKTSEVRELQYEAAWKMGRWNIDTPNKLDKSVGFHECLYKGVKALQENDLIFTQSALDKARLCTMSSISGGCLDAVGKLYPVLADLQCVNILGTVTHMMVRQGQSRFEFVLPGIDQRQTTSTTDFEFQSPSLYMNCTAWQTLWQRSELATARTRYLGSLQLLASQAREAGRHQICERAVQQLKGLAGGDLAVELECQREEAQLFWARHEPNIAKHLARGLLDRLKKLQRDEDVAARFYPAMLSLYGNWLAETRSENPNIIMEEYLEKTVALLEKSGDVTDTCIDAYLSLARYADTQYQSIVDYMKSSTFEAKNSLMNKSRAEYERLRRLDKSSASKDFQRYLQTLQKQSTPDTKELQLNTVELRKLEHRSLKNLGFQRYLRTLQKQSTLDAKELQDKLEDRERFLMGAVDGYIKCLRLGDAHSLRVFRLASLWFNNANNDEVNNCMKEAVEGIQTYKWLPLMYQLAARMDVKPRGDSSEPFLTTLNQLIYSTAVSHPHHTLSCVLALANGERDRELEEEARVSKRASKLSKTSAPAVAAEGRILAARQMIEKLRGDERVGQIVKQMQAVCDAYIQLANWNVNQFKTETKPIQLPSALWISGLKELQHVPILTREIKVEPSGCYDNIAYIHKFQPTFKLAGGINLPKIITCVGSDGQSSRLLVKGKDDLRQDAVMQQVFGMVNSLLMKDAEARKRKLHIRKYRVIPLSQRSGLLEWCEGTQPVGEYLIGSVAYGVKGAHQRYRPKDWPAPQCRKHLTEAAGNAAAQYKAYQEVCAKFQPVFRHFFLEKFAVPSVWFERRLAYTRSVATNSIVGYILGLGDRHVQNILIDCSTAELVHIDLGVAFETGRILTVPETVPFRLTRDIEDAMGSCGVEGVYRRCCERTLEVMRTNQEAVLTILEVLLYDPLHEWTISPHKAYELQQKRDRGNDTLDVFTTPANNGSGDTENHDSAGSSASETAANVNKLAERVLLRLRQKLQGVEDGAQLSLAGQVNHLIQEARNPKNLARIYSGWQPYI